MVLSQNELGLEDIEGVDNTFALQTLVIGVKPWKVESKNVFGPPIHGSTSKFVQPKAFMLPTIPRAPKMPLCSRP